MDHETGIESATQFSDIWTPCGSASPEVSTLVHYCRNHAHGRMAAAPAFTHVTGEPGEHDRLSFAQLDARARTIAAEIQRRGGVGKPVLVVLDPGADYAASLFGCLYARAIAVPIYPPQMLRLQHTLPRLKAIIENADANIMLSDRSTIGESLSSMWRMPSDGAIAVDEIDSAAADGWDGRLPKPHDIALLQYTSGSTGNPRGVVLTHRTLLSNLAAIVEHVHFEGARSVQWVPPYHDMGLIGGILLPIYRGVETVIISPADFVRNPLLWLRCIDHYRGSSNGAPNFGYELCVRRVDHADCEGLDLSSWKMAVAGAEPVRAATLRRFEEKFARYGFESTAFCPAFGMAETTVMATGSRLGEPYRTFHVDAQSLQLGKIELVSPGPQSTVSEDVTGTMSDAGSSRRAESSDDGRSRPVLELVSSGTPVAGMHYEIVDPQTHRALPDGEIGEIWVRGGSVASGYWQDDEASQYTFHANLAAAPENPDVRAVDATADYLRTGDLAARVDGELIVTGRLKELIIVAGRNFYPHDIEQIVQSTSEAFKPDTGTALSVDIGDSEEMVVIQELWRPKKFPADELLPEVVAAIAEQAQVTPASIVLVRSGSLPKTSSGKLRRTDAKKLFLEGELVELARWESGTLRATTTRDIEPPATATETQIAEIWSRILDVEAIGRGDDFFHLGGSSLLVANMLIEVGECYSVAIPMKALFCSPTLEGFSALVDSHSAGTAAPPTIAPSGIQWNETNPLSSAQQRFWLLDQLGQTNAFVHVPISIQLDRPLALQQLQSACGRVLDRHPMLRARFTQIGADVTQSVDEVAEVDIRTFLNDPSDENELSSERREFLNAPFDLSQPPLMRVAVTNQTAGGCRIDIVLHHLVCDASSLQILLADLQREFAPDSDRRPQRDDDSGCDEGSAAAQLRYVDYAAWDFAPQRRDQIQERVNYWAERLAGMPADLNLPQCSNRHRDAAVAHSSDSGIPASTCVSPDLMRQIDNLAISHNLTPSMVYLTALEWVLARYGASDDFGITIPTSSRPASQLRDVVGCFVNPIVYRAEVDGEQTVASLLSETRDALLSDLEHADVPFQDVVAVTGGARDTDRMPLSPVMFLYQPPLPSVTRFGAARVTSVQPDYSAVTAYDVSLIVQPGETTEMTVVLGELVSPDLGDRILSSMQTVLRQLVAPDVGQSPISSLSILSVSDRASLESAQQGKKIENRSQTSVVDRLREHVEHQPDALAIRDDHTGLTYREVNEQSDRIAAALVNEGVRPSPLVALAMPRRAEAIVAIIGIWKAGAAYVPIDLDLPDGRRDQILRESGAEIVVDPERWDVWTQRCDTSPQPTFLDASINPTDLAYVMYTSGSTGKPKGVAVSHSNLVNLLTSFGDEPGFSASDSMFAVTTMSFDISLLEMFLPLWCGGHVCLTAHRIGEDPESVIAAIEQSHPSVIQSTPSAFRMLLSANWRPAPGTRLLCGGEPMLADLARDLLATSCELWNVYGPTETTVWSTVTRIDSAEKISIGHPIANTICRVVDRHGLLAPTGVAGELHIGGAGVAQGYWRDPTQTEERFFIDQGERFYKTGDQVRRTPNGDLEFLARNDRQIKLRGFRIELDEIESMLQQCRGVDRAAVVLRNADVPGGSRMVAFFSGPGTVETVRAQLTGMLPDYMIPATIAWLETLPRTPAGKTDYTSLPLDTPPRGEPDDASTQTPLEGVLAEMWCEVLGRQSVGRHDHFFDLGGNSLMAAQLFARLRQRFDVNLPLREVYSRPTIAALAEAIVIHQAETEADDLSDLLGQLDTLSDDDVLRALEETNKP
ncbi:non-ribosomal peptide synthetase [Allorhodopirellula solitaria]|uniref:non-ribosomal peptide synthetase n=1 Tax=Allorhodopirellula solitaria TaxID=2527987 RepID=UPI0011B711A3|nr:non-ribosomal peptide synthetase [Allorhodopirellula solitaria]